MSKLEILKSYIPSIYDDVTETQEILEAEAIEFEELDSNILSVEDNVFIDTATNSGLSRCERIFKISVPIGATLDERRSVLKSVLRGIDKLSATVIKNISLAYQNGEVEVAFVPSNIVIKFVSTFGVPPNIEELKKYLNKRIPSHLGITYILKYINIDEIEAMTLLEIEEITLDKFAF